MVAGLRMIAIAVHCKDKRVGKPRSFCLYVCCAEGLYVG